LGAANHIVILFHTSCQENFVHSRSLPIYYIERGQVAFGMHRRLNFSDLPEIAIDFLENPLALRDFRAIINVIAPVLFY
jgi:hypothetical protein